MITETENTLSFIIKLAAVTILLLGILTSINNLNREVGELKVRYEILDKRINK